MEPQVRMIDILSRSLRVRDDGTGNGRETDGTFAEFEIEDAIILLGDPGMGKTTLFRYVAKANYTTVRKFLIDPRSEAGEALFLDALDEYRTIASGQDASAAVAKALCSLKKPKFRLSCRAADWFGSTDQEILKVASASGRIVVLELCPLSRDEIMNAVQGIVEDPVVFLDEAESAGLGKLLGNPQTLELLTRAWGTDKKPRNKFEAYEIGVSELLKEINPEHVERGGTSPDPSDLRKAASAAASILLLSNSVGISRAEPADGNGYVRLTDVPYPNMSALDTCLRRRLFFSPEVDRFEPVHRTIAEFLAAEDLSKRVTNGLPIDRVMALICGIDGRPSSSLRGLFAWLMCKVGPLAEYYVGRDPYGVATYGDASVLPPSAQRAVWIDLRKLRDPWFLTNDDDRGTFRDLANPNTADIIKTILQDPAAGVHLKIAALEAIANSTAIIGLDEIIRDIVMEKHDNTWLRATALRAYAKSVKSDWVRLQALDYALAQASDDLAAPEVRVELLRQTLAFGILAERVLSIMTQVVSTKKEQRIIGRFYSLISLPSDADLDVILDGASQLSIRISRDCYEIQSLLDKWLKRRLESPSLITPAQLSSWLRNIWGAHDRKAEKTLSALKVRFEQDPLLFEEVFELLANDIPNEEHSFWLFVVNDLWELLPASVWPVPQCEFFLTHAEKEKNPEHAADLFRMYLMSFPVEGGSIALAEACMVLLDRRHDVAKVLGNWKSCKIEKWRKDQSQSLEEKSRKHAMTRAQNVAYLTPRLTMIREGREKQALVWATKIYMGVFYDVEKVPDARERLVSVTNEEIADVLIQGFIRYATNPNIPKKETIIESWQANSIPYIHILLSLSVFLRLNAGVIVPARALPHCIAAVVTNFDSGYKVAGHDEALLAWILHQMHQTPSVVKSVLKEMWIASATVKRGSLPGFYELNRESSAQQFLASLSADVLRSGINDDHETVGRLVLVLLHQDQRAVITISESELARHELFPEVRIIWSTALFMVDATKYLNQWKTLMSQKDAAMWESIKIIRGDRHDNRKALNLTSAQRSEIIAAVGQRFANVGHPPNGWSGSQNPWDAAEFVANQIKMLASDGSADAGTQLERLENNGSLASYHDLIRHHRAQHEKQQRESSFSFASPEQVSEMLRNCAPATPNDLLAFIVDHLGVLAYELTRTQRERYRAYWNEKGRNLTKPKREEVCSGLLAEDLQNRVRVQTLIVTVEHHMVAEKECDLVVLQGSERLLPIEVKHHYHRDLWTAWSTQLDRLYTRDAKAGGLGIYLVLWSGEAKGRKMPKLSKGLKRPTSADELRIALESLIPEADRHRLRVIVVDISGP